MTALDDLTVQYTLSHPTRRSPSALASAPIGMPFDPAAAAADSSGYSLNPIGTGPFAIKSRDIDNETVVEKNPDYWRTDADGVQLPYLDSVSFRPIPDEGTRLDALLSGTTTAMQTLRQGTIRDARNAAGGDSIKLIEFQGNSTGGGMYNTAIAPFDDVARPPGPHQDEQPGERHRGARRHRHLAADHPVVLLGQPVVDAGSG